MVSVTQIRPDGSASTRRYSGALALVGALVLALVAIAGYTVGSNHGNRLKVLTGNAYVGVRQASVKVDGWAYGMSDSVPWVDSAGTHESGWPACLGRSGTTVRIRFAEVPVTGAIDDGWRAVAWVDCRGAVVVR